MFPKEPQSLAIGSGDSHQGTLLAFTVAFEARM